jgi:hypothetical protein
MLITEQMHRAALRAHGFGVGPLVGLVGAGLAVAKPETMKAAGRSFSVVRFVITKSRAGTERKVRLW